MDQTFSGMADLSVHHLHARSACHIKLKFLAEGVALPERQCFRMLAVIAFRNEGVTDLQRRRHMLDQGREEITARCRRRTHDDGPERLLCAMALGYVEHQRDDADYLSFGIELRGESARFP